jgi:hypothetical protein
MQSRTIEQSIDIKVNPEAQDRLRINPNKEKAEIHEAKLLLGAVLTKLIDMRTRAHSFGPVYDDAINQVVQASLWFGYAATNPDA